MHIRELQTGLTGIRTLKSKAQQLWLLTRCTTPAPSNAIAFEPIGGEGGVTITFWNERYRMTHRCTNLKFVHVGKCGGTSIKHHFVKCGIQLEEYHRIKPPVDSRTWYLLWVRDPMTRFVSAFNHAKEILDFDISAYDCEALTLENCPAPERVRDSVHRDFMFDPVYDRLVDTFASANDLAESLSSPNRRLRRQAYELMTNPQEHIFKGLGWHLHNGLFVTKFHRQFAFVGRMEHLEEDFRRFQDLVGFPDSSRSVPERKRASSGSYSHDLSARAIENLREFYSGSDYKTLRELVRYGLLDPDTLEEYDHS